TPAARRLLPLLDTDLGRPLADLRSGLVDQELLPDAERVLQGLTPIEREVADVSGQSFLRRILPYRTEDDRIDGVVITFTDVTRLRQQESVLRSLNERLQTHVDQRSRELRQLIENALDGIVIVNDDGVILDLNPRIEELFGWPRAELLGKTLEVLVP